MPRVSVIVLHRNLARISTYPFAAGPGTHSSSHFTEHITTLNTSLSPPS